MQPTERVSPCWCVTQNPSNVNTLFGNSAGEGKTKNKIQSTYNMSDDEKGNKGEDDGTNPFNLKHINNPTMLDELPEDLKQQIQAKFDAVLKAFFESYSLKIGRTRLLNSKSLNLLS